MSRPQRRGGAQVVEHRAEEWPVPAIARVQLHRDVGLRGAGQRVGGRVDVVRVRQRAHQRRVVHEARGQRQVLADVQARHAGGDGLELAADIRRGIRLQVEGFELAGRAVQIKQDARFGLAEAAGPARRRRGRPRLLEAQQARPGQSEQRQSARAASRAASSRRTAVEPIPESVTCDAPQVILPA